MKSIIIIKTLVSFVCVLGLFSCSDNKITYMGKLEASEEFMLTSHVLNKDFILSASPAKMIILDSLLIIGDSYTQENFIHVFNKKTGLWITSFGKRGNGPGELLHPIDLWLDKNNNLIVYSPNIRKIIEYKLSDWIQGVKTFSEKNIGASPHSGINHMYGSENGIFVSGFTKEMRFGLYADDKIHTLYKDVPLIKTDVSENENAAIMVYGSLWNVSPDGKKMVQGTYIGAILEFFHVDTAYHITSTRLLPIIKPEYNIISGVKPFGIGWCMETIFGFHSFYVNNDYVYALFNGGKAADDSFYAKQIIKFDWNGNILTSYKLDVAISRFVLDEKENRIYAITQSDAENPMIIKFVE